MRVVVCDIDGTLIAPNSDTISQQNISAVKQLHKKNVLFILATGRVFQGIQHLIPLLELNKYQSYAICNNGAQIYDLKTGKEIYEKSLNESHLFEINEVVNDKVAILLNQSNYAVMSKYNEYGIQHDHDKINYDFYWPQDITKHFKNKTYRVMITDKKECLDEIETQLKSKMASKVAIARNNDIFLDVTHMDADKGIALSYLLNKLELNIQDVIACGDGGNDINMLKQVGIGLVLDNAQQYVKDAVGNTVIHAKDHIVEYILNKYIK